MKLPRVRLLLSLGLAAKLAAVVLALILAWPLVASQPQAVQAQEKKAPPPPKAADKTAAETPPGPDQQKAKEGEDEEEEPAPKPSPESNPALINLIESKRAELAEQEARLAQERRDLEALRQEINQRIAELKKVQNALSLLVKEEQTQRRKRILQLVKVLSNMRGPQAAAVVEKLDDQMAVEIISLMQSRKAGALMANLKPDQAARISELLARQKAAQRAGRLAAQAAAQGAQPPPAAPPGKKK